MGIVTLLTAAFFLRGAILILGFVLVIALVFFRLDNVRRWRLRRIRGNFFRRRQLRFELLDFAQERVKFLLKSLRHNRKDNILSNIKKDQFQYLFL